MSEAAANAGAVGASGGSDRLEVVDIIRGFALTALFLVHMIESYELYWLDPKPGPIADTVYLLFMGKSFSLLALCFGFSFYILMERAARRGTDFTARFAWRLTVLLVIGTLHSWVYRGDIIQLLAGMGFVLLLAHRVKSNKALIALAVFCFLGPLMLTQIAFASAGYQWANQPPNHWTDPAMPIYVGGSLLDALVANLWVGQWPKWWFMIESGRLVQILGLYLVGMVLGRIGFFARPEEFVRPRMIALAIAAAVAVLLYFTRAPLATMFETLDYGAGANRAFRALLGSWFELSGTAIWALLLIALFLSAGQRLIRPFAGIGRLTLTLYVAQSLVFVPVFYGFGLGAWDDWSQATRLLVGLAAVAAQMVIAAAWLRRYHYGPLEWAWRALTYLSWDIPFRRKSGEAEPA